jgi:hypothetical protein
MERVQLARMATLMRRAASAGNSVTRAVDVARNSSFFNWALNGHFVADREPLNFRLWPYLAPIYKAIPNDLTRLDIVIMKSAQGGASTLAMLFALWLALRSRCQIAYFLPTEALARKFSTTRFLRMVRGNPELHELMGDKQDPRRRRIANEGSAATRQIVESILHFTHIEGRAATEALPLDSLIFDEVQEMLLADMEKAVERMSASPLQAVLRVSTATYPGASIDYFFQDSDQREFHTRCRCPGGVVLSDHFDATNGPGCIGRGNGSTPGVPTDLFYRCPHCGTVIRNPQDGEFRARNPSARRIGFHFPQLLSPRIRPVDIIQKWETRLDTQNFFNRVLGRPYADPKCMPVTLAHLQAAQNSDLRWGVSSKQTVPTRFMGIDQMGQTQYVVIVGQVADRVRLLHLEIIQGADPWRRSAQLLKEYDVRVCALEQLLNFDNAHRFAKDHDGRVFLVHYADLSDEMVLWGDRSRDKVAVRRTEDEARTRWTATVDQYRMMSWALGKWGNGEVETPDARTLTQDMRTDRGTRNVQVCQDVFWHHLQNVALVTEPLQGREEEHRFRRRVVKVGTDPHFAYAWMLCMVAWTRRFGITQMLLTDSRFATEVPCNQPQPSPYLQQIIDAMPENFHGTIHDPDAANLTCGDCQYFDVQRGLCRSRDLLVKAGDRSCDFFDVKLDGE